MAEITLADYAGYIFLEIIRAREMADHYSREVARRYGSDEVMRHFSVPRFKVPKMDLTIPVLISGARFKQVLRFKLDQPEFTRLVDGRLREVVKTVQLYKSSVFDVRPTLVAAPLQPMQPLQPVKPGPVVQPTQPLQPGVLQPGVLQPGVLQPGVLQPGAPKPPLVSPVKPGVLAPGVVNRAARRGKARASTTVMVAERAAETVPEAITEFHQRLLDNPDPAQPAQIVTLHWAGIFKLALEAEDLWALYQKHNPNNELFNKTNAEMLRLVQANTIVERTTIENLLINPETQQVKDGSSESSVFTIRAEMLEEGFFIRTVRDEATGATQQVVEFE